MFIDLISQCSLNVAVTEWHDTTTHSVQILVCAVLGDSRSRIEKTGFRTTSHHEVDVVVLVMEKVHQLLKATLLSTHLQEKEISVELSRTCRTSCLRPRSELLLHLPGGSLSHISVRLRHSLRNPLIRNSIHCLFINFTFLTDGFLMTDCSPSVEQQPLLHS